MFSGSVSSSSLHPLRVHFLVLVVLHSFNTPLSLNHAFPAWGNFKRANPDARDRRVEVICVFELALRVALLPSLGVDSEELYMLSSPTGRMYMGSQREALSIPSRVLR